MKVWQYAYRGLLSAVLLIGLAAPALPAQVGVAANLHPYLAHIARVAPEQLVTVIVQKAGQGQAAETLAGELGGTVTQDLHIINAFAAYLPASAAAELAASPAVRWVSPDAQMQAANNSSRKFTTWATAAGTLLPNGFANFAEALSPAGPDGAYASGANVVGSFRRFTPEYSPGQTIKKVHLILRLYVSAKLGNSEAIRVQPWLPGQTSQTITIPAKDLSGCVGVKKACTLNLDVTAGRAWTWVDLLSVQVGLDQTALSGGHVVYYDAVGIQVTTGKRNSDTDDASTPLVFTPSDNSGPTSTNLTNVFNAAIRATDVWNEGPAYLQGQGVTVAVVDSGSFDTDSAGARLIGQVNFNSAEHSSSDGYGHGTFVASLAAGGGDLSGGQYKGSAPEVSLLNLRVSDDLGISTESDTVAALQWILENKAAYNIRVVNMSLNSSAAQPYHTSPLDAAAEILWFNGVVVVVSAGNNGSSTLFAPADDPFVITVGAANDQNTAAIADDTLAHFSAWGTTAGVNKPDLVAPGANIIGYLPDNSLLKISVDHPANRVSADYFRMSGTSMSAPIVAGAAALLLQDEPNLTPDQVKYRLMSTANTQWAGYDPAKAGAGYLDIYAAVHGASTESANQGLQASQLLWTGDEPVNWSLVMWNSVMWNSVMWNSVMWNSVMWNSVMWNSDYWGQP
jgi:serine protease AprX